MHGQNGESDRPFSTQLIRITLSLNENLGAIVMDQNRWYTCMYMYMYAVRWVVVYSLVTNQLNNVLPAMFGWQIMANNNTKNCYENGALSTENGCIERKHAL